MMRYGLITPYFTPGLSTKRINYGDGLILGAIQREIGQPAIVLSSRAIPQDTILSTINQNLRCLVIAGANQFGPSYSLFDGAGLQLIEKIKIPVIPFGVGRNFVGSMNEIEPAQKKLLSAIFRNTPFASWRCNNTRHQAQSILSIPEDGNLYTGCPVHHSAFSENNNFCIPGSVLVSITDRGKDFLEKEIFFIERCLDIWEKSSIGVVFQQSLISKRETLSTLANSELRQRKSLIKWLQKKNIKMEIPTSISECYSIYSQYESHIGSRLHVHLSFRSMAKPSLCFAVDNRASDYLSCTGEPLGSYNFRAQDLACDRYISKTLEFDYRTFLKKIKNLILDQ